MLHFGSCTELCLVAVLCPLLSAGTCTRYLLVLAPAAVLVPTCQHFTFGTSFYPILHIVVGTLPCLAICALMCHFRLLWCSKDVALGARAIALSSRSKKCTILHSGSIQEEWLVINVCVCAYGDYCSQAWLRSCFSLSLFQWCTRSHPESRLEEPGATILSSFSVTPSCPSCLTLMETSDWKLVVIYLSSRVYNGVPNLRCIVDERYCYWR